MISFDCPKCRRVFTMTDTAAGKKITCPQCGQRMEIPSFRDAITSQASGPGKPCAPMGLPESLPSGAATSANPLANLAPANAGAANQLVARQKPRRWVALTAAAGICLVGLVGVLAGGWWFSIPRESREGQQWSNRELVEHLQKQGIQFKARAIPAENQNFESVMVFVRKEQTTEQFVVNIWDLWTRSSNNLFTDDARLLKTTQIAIVIRYNSPDQARDEVRKAIDDYLASANVILAWGRFVFIGDPQLLTEIRRGLAGQRIGIPPGADSTGPSSGPPETPNEVKSSPPESRPPTARTEEKSSPEELAKGLKSKNVADRVRAAELLAKQGDKAKPAARALCEAATDESKEVRLAAIDALEKVRPDLVKFVVTLITDDNAFNHLQATRHLEKMGAAAQDAVPVLIWHCRSPNAQQVTQLVAQDLKALGKIGRNDPAAITVIMSFAGGPADADDNWGVQTAALTSLGELSNSTSSLRGQIVAALVAALKNLTKSNRSIAAPLLAAINSTAQFGPDAKEAIPVLKELRLNPDINVRNAAGAALEKISKQP